MVAKGSRTWRCPGSQEKRREEKRREVESRLYVFLPTI
jgi:hypothetical protein